MFSDLMDKIKVDDLTLRPEVSEARLDRRARVELVARGCVQHAHVEPGPPGRLEGARDALAGSAHVGHGALDGVGHRDTRDGSIGALGHRGDHPLEHRLVGATRFGNAIGEEDQQVARLKLYFVDFIGCRVQDSQ